MSRDLKTLTILMRASHRLEAIVKDEVQAHGLTISEFGTLEALYHKGTLTVAEIVAKILIPNSSMSYVLERLLEKGLIERTQDEGDKRVYRLTLTEAGHNYIREVYPLHQKALRQLLDRLTPDEEEILQQLLKKIGKD